MTTAAKTTSEVPLLDPTRFGWDTLTRCYPWIAAMRGVPQNPIYHAEGDVWVHTEMVMRALLTLPAWQQSDWDNRSRVFAAALLHDVAKPKTTELDDSGIPSSPGHAKKGEAMARIILEQNGIASYTRREAICKLVRHHGLPLWFLDKTDLPRALARASWECDLRQIVLLAEADVRGRICPDQNNLLDTITLFGETARELDCWDQPRPFVSDHARFAYFQNPEATLDYAAFDDRTFTVTVLCGLPGSGKDSWIAGNASDLPVISLDVLRRTMKFAPGTGSAHVAAAGREQARELLRQKQPFVWNATNLSRMVRQPLIELFASYGARVRVVLCHTPMTDVLARNANRDLETSVPRSKLWDMLARFEPPSLAECHELILTESASAA